MKAHIYIREKDRKTPIRVVNGKGGMVYLTLKEARYLWQKLGEAADIVEAGPEVRKYMPSVAKWIDGKV